MATESEVEQFLKDFHQKRKVFDIVFRDERNKNLQTLADLDITWAMRKKNYRTTGEARLQRRPIG